MLTIWANVTLQNVWFSATNNFKFAIDYIYELVLEFSTMLKNQTNQLISKKSKFSNY